MSPSAWSWLCSMSSVLAALVLALLAVHGWILGDSASVSENTGPFLLEVHVLVLGILVLFATWAACPVWLMLCLSPRFRRPGSTLIIQAVIFALGWLAFFGAMSLVEASPARHVF